jgi:hypothetical protein
MFLEGMRKTTKNPSQDSLSTVRDLNLTPREHEAEVLTTGLRRSVCDLDLSMHVATSLTV